MQEQLTIALKPERITVTAGAAPAQVSVVIQNQTSVIDSFALELADLAPEWYTLPVKTIALFPNEQKTISIAFHAPANPDTLAGRYDYTVRVRSTAVAGRLAQATGVLFVAVPEAIGLRLKKEQVRGQQGKFDVILSNRSKAPLVVAPAVQSEDDIVEFAFEPATIPLPPGGSQVVELTVRLRPGQVIMAERGFRFIVSAQTTDEREKSNTVEATFQYVPGQVRLELLPARVKGIEGRFNLNVSNPGINTMPMECLLSGKDPDNVLDIVIQQPALTLQPGTSIILPVTVRLKAGRKPELKSYNFTIAVRQGGANPSPTAPELGPPIAGEFIYEPPIAFDLTVERTQSGGSGGGGPQMDYVVKIVNPSHAGLRLSLRADDPQQALDLFFGNRVDQIQVNPGVTVDVQLLARLKSAPPAQRTIYPFTISAHAIPDDGSAETDKTADGEFVAGGPKEAMLRLDILPDTARGEVGKFQLRLASGISTPLQVALRGRDDTGVLQYEFEPARLELKVGTVELADLTVRARDGVALDTDIGYHFSATAWVPGMGTDGATEQQAVWFYTPPTGPITAPITLQLNPQQVIGDTGQFAVTVANVGVDPLSVILRGSDEAESLEFLFQVPRVQLQPKEVTEISLIVRGLNGEPLAGPFRYPFEVAGWVPGMAQGEQSVQYGEMVVTEAPKAASRWKLWQRLAIAGGLVLWMALPFILDPIFRKNATLYNLLPLVYQYLPALMFPILGAAMYGTHPTEVRGWRAMLVGWISMGGIITFILPDLLPPNAQIFGFAATPFLYLIMLPALVIVLLA
ncbi:MAG TPA: hypothetical protein VKY74_00745 [Chloroflexia bacterium]|nr:hypothetical protein [Chloroflexia bacterium]